MSLLPEGWYIVKMGHYYPETIEQEITNDFIINDLGVDATNNFAESYIGSVKRYTALKKDYLLKTKNADPSQAFARDAEGKLINATESVSDMIVKAAKNCLKMAEFKPDDVDHYYCNSASPDQLMPSSAARIAGMLGSKKPGTDLYSVCSGFGYHVYEITKHTNLFLNILNEKMGNVDDEVIKVLTDVLKEKSKSSQKIFMSLMGVSGTSYTNYETVEEKKNRQLRFYEKIYDDKGNLLRSDGAPLIWGDGAAASLIVTSEIAKKIPGPKIHIEYSDYDGDSTQWQAVQCETDGHGHFHQNGKAVRNFSVFQTIEMIEKYEEMGKGINWDNTRIIFHQANSIMHRSILEGADIPYTSHWSNFANYGNIGGASAAAVLSQNWKNLTNNMEIIVAVLGSNLSWSSFKGKVYI